MIVYRIQFDKTKWSCPGSGGRGCGDREWLGSSCSRGLGGGGGLGVVGFGV